MFVEGRWSTEAGLTADELTDLVSPLVSQVEVTPLTDAALWGKQISDERYALVGRL